MTRLRTVNHTNIWLNWARIVNRKNNIEPTNELIEDLGVTPDIPIDVLMRPMSDGVTYIKTIFEYRRIPNITCTNREK